MQWIVSPHPIEYPEALARMAQYRQDIQNGTGDEVGWLLEHPPLYTAGTSAQAKDLLNPQFPVFETGRGGQYTYHGPGQRVAYLMLDLKQRGRDVRAYVQMLERWIIATLASFEIEGFTREGRIGVWVQTPSGGEAKIAALGVRIQQWVTTHGVAINLNPDLSHYLGIIPCGIQEFGVTSLWGLGVRVGMAELDLALQRSFMKVFG